MSQHEDPGFDEALLQAKSAKDANRFEDCVTAADRALAVKPTDCYAAAIRIGCHRKLGTSQAKEAAAWAKERAETCDWHNYFRSERAWSIYIGWLKLDAESKITREAYRLACKAARRILGMTKTGTDTMVRCRATLRILDIASKEADWKAVLEFSDLASGEEFDQTRPVRTQQLPNPESDYEKWARHRAEALRNVGRQTEAVTLVSAVDDRWPGNIWLARERGLCECSAGQHAAGAKRLEGLFARRQDFYLANEIGDCCEAAREPERAASWYACALSRTSPQFGIKIIEKLGLLLEQTGDIPGALAHRRLALATAENHGWTSRAVRSRNELTQFLQRHHESVGGSPLERLPQMGDAQRDCKPIWDRLQQWRPPGGMTGRVDRYGPARLAGEIVAGGKKYSFSRDDFESPRDPEYDQLVEFVSEEGPEGQLIARSIRPR